MPAVESGEAQLCQEILQWLPDHLLVEILSRLPAKPVHRFKCVSKWCRDLICDPNHRKSLPQSLAGFIYWADEDEYVMQFINASGRGPPLVDLALAFLPNDGPIFVLDCCNGLLLLGSGSDYQPHDYVVCNPATKKWVALPDSGVGTEVYWHSILAFDPAVSSHFHVLEYVNGGTVRIYSSHTGGWSHTVPGQLSITTPHERPAVDAVYLNGMLHILMYEPVARAINLETKEWRDIELPGELPDDHTFFRCFLGQSQGCLNLENGPEISVWTLEDYGSSEWILKHSLRATWLFRWDFLEVLTVHPECNMVFYHDYDENG